MNAPFAPLLAAGLVAALGYAAWRDLSERIIPNWLNAGIALAAPAWWWATGYALWPDVPLQILLGAGLFALFAGAFMIGAMGGGDVKLIAALGLWLPLQPMMGLLFLMSLAGGAVTLATVAHHRWRRAEGRPEIPYGLAISAAGVWVISQRYIYHFA